MSADHLVTVVLPTHRRPAGLRRALQGLARQADPGGAWDVVVVDNDAAPGTAQAIVDSVGEVGVPVRVVLETTLGASWARNAGIREAKGSIVAFLDDDVEPADDWLRALVRPLVEGRCDGVGGRVRLDPSVGVPSWMPVWLLPYLAEYHPSPHPIDLSELPAGVLTEPYLLTANAAFTRDILDRAGGFDPLLGPRSGVPMVNDDVSLCRRVFAAGGVILYEPAAEVEHELPRHRLTRRFFIRRLYAQGRSDWLLDREVVGTRRTAGANTATVAFALHFVRLAREGLLPPQPYTYLWTQIAWRSGYLREALAHLARGRVLPDVPAH